MSERETMEYDVVVVGAGPAGLSFAIRLKQLKPDTTVCVIEKASTVGAQILSGAVIEPQPLDALLPGWRDNPPPICVPATEDEFWLLSADGGRKLPVPPGMNNHGNFIVSLGAMCAWLAPQAEALGVDVFPGFAAADTVYNEDGSVAGVRIGDMGVARDGSHKSGYTQGIDIKAKVTVLAEGARGSLTKQLIKRFELDKDSDPQGFSIGIKELWQVPAGRVSPGKIVHSVGWPADNHTYGGSFLYHLDGDRIALGYVSGLDYRDPNYMPWEAFQQWKNHPSVKPLLEGGEIVSAGARAIVTGGYQSLPKVEMPGALLIGDTAGLLNVPKIKGTHQAIRSGMLAAEHLAAHDLQPAGFDAQLRDSAVMAELQESAQRQARLQEGLLVRPGQRRLGNRHRRSLALDAEEQTGLVPDGKAGRVRGAQARLPPARPSAARSPGRGVLRRHRARRGPAGPPARGRHQHLHRPLHGGVRQPLPALLPGQCLRDRRGRGWQAAADQCRQLRALQDLRHQGPVRDHQLGHARRRLGAELPESVGQRGSH